MKERSPQDQQWNEQRVRNGEFNRALADNVFWRGQFWRSTIMSRRTIFTKLREAQRANQDEH